MISHTCSRTSHGVRGVGASGSCLCSAEVPPPGGLAWGGAASRFHSAPFCLPPLLNAYAYGGPSRALEPRPVLRHKMLFSPCLKDASAHLQPRLTSPRRSPPAA